MADGAGTEAVWHNDGHSISLTLNRAVLEVVANPCPFEPDEERDCGHEDTRCVFEYYVNLFGEQCNYGISPARPQLDVAWAILGSGKFLDESELRFFPIEDEAFASFLEEKLAPRDV